MTERACLRAVRPFRLDSGSRRLEREVTRYGLGVGSVFDPEEVRPACGARTGREPPADLVVVAEARSGLRSQLLPGEGRLSPFGTYILASVAVDLLGTGEGESILREQVERREFVQVLHAGTCVVRGYVGRGRFGLIVAAFDQSLRQDLAGEDLRTVARRWCGASTTLGSAARSRLRAGMPITRTALRSSGRWAT